MKGSLRSAAPLAGILLVLAGLGALASANVVSIEATAPETAEPGPLILVRPGEFTVRRTGDLDSALAVALSYSGTATPGTDYAELPERVEFAAGEASVSFLVLGLDDDEVEEDETVVATLQRRADGTVLNYEVDPEHSSARVVIRDTDRPTNLRPTVSIEATVPETAEPAPNVRVIPGEFTIRRRGDLRSNEPAQALTVFLSYRGSATPGKDYEALPERVEFAAGEDTVTLKVHAIDDEEVEGDETVVATLVDPTLGPLPLYNIAPDRSSARVVIRDSDDKEEPGVVSIEATRRIAEETAAPLRRLNLVGEFTVSRTGSTENDQPVWVLVSGSATPRADYEPLPSLVTIPAGESSRSFPVTALFDEIPEGIETVVATLSQCPPEGSLAPCFLAEIDPARSSDTVYIREDGLTVATVHLTAPASGDHFPVGQRIRLEAVAIHLESYIGRVEFCAGDTVLGVSEIFFFRAPDPGTPITHEFVWERPPAGTHELTAKATIPGEDANSRGETIVSSPVRITVGGDPPPSNESPSVEIVAPASGDRFPPRTPISITVEATDPDGFITRIEYFAEGGRIGVQNISYLVEPPPGETQTFSFDWEHPMPGPHRLTVRVTDNRRGTGESQPVAIAVASDDPTPIVNVIARDAVATEPGNSSRPVDTATFHLRRHGSTVGDLTVRYSLGGRAENGIDYERLSGETVIPDGSSGVDVTVVPLADRETEGPESVILEIVADPAYRTDSPRRASAVIRDASALQQPDRPRCVRLADGLLLLCFPAETGACFRIESTTNLRDWSTLFCLVAVDGTVNFVHERSPDHPHRYFRITREPNALPE